MSLITVLGGITAGVVHGIIAEDIKRFVVWKPVPWAKVRVAERAWRACGAFRATRLADTTCGVSVPQASAADLFPAKFRTVVGIVVAVLLAAFIAGLNFIKLSPDSFFPADDTFTRATWNPAFAGIFIGILQLPLTATLSKNVGSASTMQTLASMLFMGTNKYPQMNKMKWGISRWWQVTYLVAALGASALASSLSSASWYRGDDITYAQAFIGGFLVILGARVASGCTSGHGISGAGHLMWRSFAAIGAMFAGAIAARYALASTF